MFAKDATITHQHYGMDIELEGVDPDDVVNLLTPGEIANVVDLDDMLSALVAKHGIGEVVYALHYICEKPEIITHLYECDPAAVDLFISERKDQEL